MKLKEFCAFLQSTLNEQQYKAAVHTNGPLLIIAGAGSGKTRVITSRIAYLIRQKKIPAHAILALTFTNKAAQEMKERVKEFLQNSKELPFIGTFHSYCLYLLRSYQDILEMSSFSILDADDQERMIKQLIKKYILDKKINAKQLRYALSKFANAHALGIQERVDPSLKQIATAYNQEKKLSNCLDFDDLLITIYQAIKRNTQFKNFLHTHIRHILVDEYQDTNHIQHALLKQLALKNKQCIIDSLCVVGDEDQSIYSWRGATVDNILNFKHEVKNTTIINIEQNYRSAQQILTIANHVIKHNAQRNPKKLWSEKNGFDCIRQLQCVSEYQEGEAIALLSQELSRKNNAQSVAVLYRAHYQSRAIEETLIRYSVPYKIIGGTQFYERKEIKDVLAYLRLIVNPFDRVSFFRILNCPPRGLGNKCAELCRAHWDTHASYSFKQLLADILPHTSGKKSNEITQLLTLFDGLNHLDSPSKSIKKILHNSSYIAYLKQSYDSQETEDRINNVQELINAAEYLESHTTPTLESFLYEVSLLQEHTITKDASNTLYLMTLHAAKGLEFDTVILSGLEEGLFPSARSIYEDDRLEEERRLFYVGITRAKERILFTNSRFRYMYGQMVEQVPSRFLKEIPATLAPLSNISYETTLHIQHYFQNWLGTVTSAATPQSIYKTQKNKLRKSNALYHFEQ